MTNINDSEINRKYIEFARSLSQDIESPQNDISRSFVNLLTRNLLLFIRLLFIPLLFLYGSVLLLWIKYRLLSANDEPTGLHREAIKYIPDFLFQYPMHLYPIVAKSLELAFLKENIREFSKHLKGGIIEFAVGDGTLSEKIFSKEDKIIAFDINPYSLVHVKNYDHVSKMVVADCLNPPVINNGAALIVCNNLLHHITNKDETLKNWGQISRYAIFNENTNYWASGWARPYLLNLLGLINTARISEKEIERQNAQSLLSKDQLKSIIAKYYDVIEEKSFLSEKVFFLCSIFSALLFCYGPPTPKIQKIILNGPLHFFTKLLTYNLAKSLIEYDGVQTRDKDTFIFWLVKSRLIKTKSIYKGAILVCPDCRAAIHSDYCEKCQKKFNEIDGMLFLLPDGLLQEISYSSIYKDVLNTEHL